MPPGVPSRLAETIRLTRAARCVPVVPGARSMTTAEGKTGSDSLSAGCPVACPMAASRVASGTMAPCPSPGWSVAPTPNEGSVTVPVITTVRVYGPIPIRTRSPTFLPSWRRVTVPSSIWSGADSARPLVVGGCTVPSWRCRPSAGTTVPSTGSCANPNSDQPVTAGWSLISFFIFAGAKNP